MRVTRIQVENFRNLRHVDLKLTAGSVIVGENRTGKSNLVYALRLVLDPSLSSPQRDLDREDFSSKLGGDPIADGVEIRISVELADFADDPGLMAALHPALIEGEPMRARLTYRFGPREDAENGDEPPPYVWSILGGSEPGRHFPGELRQYLHHVHLGALRDAERDLAGWRRSPLRPLLENAARETDPDDLERVRDALITANEAVTDLPEVQSLAAGIAAQTESLVGSLHALDPTLDLAPAEPERTLRSLRLYLDGEAQRDLASGSLGSLNVLYMALLQLELARRADARELEHALISIEEPEAHLHPHLQRRMFRGLLASDGPKRSTIVTTHSPHIVSVTPPRQLAVLRTHDEETVASAAADADLSDREWDDIGRYLDATRGELVFARRVLLVEGFAEQVLVPLLCRDRETEPDEVGLTICAVHGTHFASYVRFLRALGTPHAVATDGDPEAGSGRTGTDRLARVLRSLDMADEDPEAAGLFSGNKTFEHDLYEADSENKSPMLAALASFKWSEERAAELESALDGDPLDADRFLKLVVTVGKGRFAQRLAGETDRLVPPDYVSEALDHLLT